MNLVIMRLRPVYSMELNEPIRRGVGNKVRGLKEKRRRYRMKRTEKDSFLNKGIFNFAN